MLRPLIDIEDKALVAAAKDIFDLHKTGVWPGGGRPEWIFTYTSDLDVGFEIRMDLAQKRVRDEIMLRWIAATRQLHPHVVAALDRMKDEPDIFEADGMPEFAADLRTIIKALLDSEKKAAFWRERTFKPCEEAHMTKPPKPTCPTLRRIVGIWKAIKAELSKYCGHPCIHSEAMGELTKEFEALFPKGVFDE